jgi:uncharacterized protein (DUF1778 family)|uniref:type II toxin-antitoxin system TacA family antitoxin n=1 Tax=Nitrospira cf. moscoviensis SBR1015 TaxID=96242 RepID=UPI000B3BAE54|nr:DUF1778 domain-containing protein [Nitrospira cf. moscoviensis SBR1015]
MFLANHRLRKFIPDLYWATILKKESGHSDFFDAGDMGKGVGNVYSLGQMTSRVPAGVPCGAFIDGVRRSDVLSFCGSSAGGTMPTTARKKSRKSSARLDVRLRSDKKALIEEAATLSGKTISEYVVSTLVQQSTEVLQRHRHIQLSDRDRDQFLALLDASDEPNATLTEAARKYKRIVGAHR